MPTGNEMRPLTTTSYALLAQVALRPWSTYELARQRVRYFRFVWPRAESAIYREVKKLAEDGLLDTRVEHTGKRKRTIYSINDAGLAELRAWLETPVSPFAMEFEAMIRLFAAPLGTTDQILESLGQVRADTSEMLRFAGEVRREYHDGHGALQDQVYVRALGIDFFISLLHTVDAWAERTIREVELWDELPIEERNRRAVTLLETLDAPEPAEPYSATPVAPKSQARSR